MTKPTALLTLDAFKSADSEWPAFAIQALGSNTILQLLDTICQHGTFRGEQHYDHAWNVQKSSSAPNYDDGFPPHMTLSHPTLALRVASKLAITYDYGDVLCLFLRVRTIASADKRQLQQRSAFPTVVPAAERVPTPTSPSSSASLKRPDNCPPMDELFPNLAKAVLDPEHQGFILGHAAPQLFAAIEHHPGGNGDMLYMPCRFESWDAAFLAMDKALHPSFIENVPPSVRRDWIVRMLIPARELSPSEQEPYDHMMSMERERRQLLQRAGKSESDILDLKDAQQFGASKSFMYWMCGPFNAILRDTVAERDAAVAALRARGFSSRSVLPRTDAAFSGSSHKRRWISYANGVLRVCKNTIVDADGRRECQPRNVIRTVGGPFASLEHLFAEIEASWPA